MTTPDPYCSARMQEFDALPKPMRALANEYGQKKVIAMIRSGYTKAGELRELLEAGRKRQQEKWLATNYVTPKARTSFELRL